MGGDIVSIPAEPQKPIISYFHQMLIVIHGSRKTGKSSLLRRMNGLDLISGYNPTKFMKASEITWNPISQPGKTIKVNVWDVVDKAIEDDNSTQKNRTKQLPDASTVDTFKRADGIIVIYDPRNEETIKYAQSIIEQAKPDTPLIILANFTDLLENKNYVHPLMESYSEKYYHLNTSMTQNLGLTEIATWLDLPMYISLRKIYEINLEEEGKRLNVLLQQFQQDDFLENGNIEKKLIEEDLTNKKEIKNQTFNDNTSSLPTIGTEKIDDGFWSDDEDIDFFKDDNIKNKETNNDINSLNDNVEIDEKEVEKFMKLHPMPKLDFTSIGEQNEINEKNPKENEEDQKKDERQEKRQKKNKKYKVLSQKSSNPINQKNITQTNKNENKIDNGNVIDINNKEEIKQNMELNDINISINIDDESTLNKINMKQTLNNVEVPNIPNETIDEDFFNDDDKEESKQNELKNIDNNNDKEKSKQKQINNINIHNETINEDNKEELKNIDVSNETIDEDFFNDDDKEESKQNELKNIDIPNETINDDFFNDKKNNEKVNNNNDFENISQIKFNFPQIDTTKTNSDFFLPKNEISPNSTKPDISQQVEIPSITSKQYSIDIDNYSSFEATPQQQNELSHLNNGYESFGDYETLDDTNRLSSHKHRHHRKRNKINS